MDCPQSNFPFIRKKVLSGVRGGAPRSFPHPFTITRLLRLLERKLDGAKNYTICGSQSDPAAEIHIQAEEGEPWNR